MEIGLYTFADLAADHPSAISPQQRIQNLMEEIELADQLDWMYLAWENIIAPTMQYPLRL